jgi:hypothetical protein
MYLNFYPSTYEADNRFYRITDSRIANLTTNVTLETCVYIHNYKPNDPNNNFRPVSPRLQGLPQPYGFSIIPNRNGRLGGISQEINAGSGYTWFVSEDAAVPTSIIDFNKWIHVTVVQDNTAKTLRTYVNGELRTSLTYVGEPNNSPPFNGMDIGRGYYATTQSFPGRISFVRLYNRPLAAAEVLQNYKATQERFSRDGLVIDSSLQLWIDADNSLSYPGSGTVITDLSGNNRTQNLSNNLFTTLSGIKCWDCSGSGYIVASNIGPTLPTTGFTYTIWARMKSSTGNYRTLLRSSPDDHPIIIWTGGNSLGLYNNGINSFTSTGYDVAALANVWVQWAVTGNASGQVFYVNGVQVGTTSTTTAGNSHFLIGGWSDGTQGFGHVAQAQLYDRVLGSHEILQNYNALKERFGL